MHQRTAMTGRHPALAILFFGGHAFFLGALASALACTLSWNDLPAEHHGSLRQGLHMIFVVTALWSAWGGLDAWRRATRRPRPPLVTGLVVCSAIMAVTAAIGATVTAMMAEG